MLRERGGSAVLRPRVAPLVPQGVSRPHPQALGDSLPARPLLSGSCPALACFPSTRPHSQVVTLGNPAPLSFTATGKPLWAGPAPPPQTPQAETPAWRGGAGAASRGMVLRARAVTVGTGQGRKILTALLLGQGSSLLPTPRLSYWLRAFPKGPRLEAPTAAVSPQAGQRRGAEREAPRLGLKAGRTQ